MALFVRKGGSRHTGQAAPPQRNIQEETKMADRHYHHHHWHRGGSDDSGMGCLVMIILGLVAMPLVGLYMLFQGDDDGQKAIGAILTIVGIIIWIAAAQG